MKILLFANTDWYLYNFRLQLAEKLRSQGHEVVLMSPEGRYTEAMERAGFRWLHLSMSRHGVNPYRDMATLMGIVRRYREERPDLVHHFTIKCVLYGSLAARLARIDAVVNAVPGLGHVFIDDSIRSRAIRPLVVNLYRFAIKGTQVIFQNPDDRDMFLKRKMASFDNANLIKGSGVDVTRFKPSGTKRRQRRKRVLLASRILWPKGLGEYVEAAGIIHQTRDDVVFMIAGESDPGNPSSVPEPVIRRWEKTGYIEVLGHRDDMQDVLAMTDIVVLPSYYGEGVPRILIEAAAEGLPLVASDTPGCREIVRQGENGLRVPVRDVVGLVGALEKLLSNDDLCGEYGKRSREIACREFAKEKVLDDTLKVYRKAVGAV